MPYQENPYFCTPPRDAIIWRYMSIDKFMLILNSQTLYFPNIYRFNDKSEGTLSDESLKEVYKTNLFNEENTPIKQDEAFIKQKEYIKQAAKSHTKEQLEEKINSLHSFTTLIKDFSNYFMFCSCWFRKEHESFIMWGEYGDKRHPASIALQTTIGDLIDSFVEYDADYDVHIGKVKYKDYHNEHIEGYECFEKENLNEPENVLKLFYAPILHKKRVFDDEHEVRATISFESICKHHLEDAIDISNIPFYSDRMFAADSRYFSSDTTNLMADVPPYGIPIRINIRKLVKTVAISKIGWEYFQKPLVELLDNKKLSPKIIISDI